MKNGMDAGIVELVCIICAAIYQAADPLLDNDAALNKARALIKSSS